MPDRRSLVLLFAIFSLTNCQWSEDRALGRHLTSDEVTGLWILNFQSVRDLESIGLELEEDRTFHQILLEPDGTCEFHTFLAMDVAFGRRPPEVTASRCRWRLRNGDRQDLSLELVDLAGKVARYHFTETTEGELIIWQYIADPDHWKYAEYERLSKPGRGR